MLCCWLFGALECACSLQLLIFCKTGELKLFGPLLFLAVCSVSSSPKSKNPPGKFFVNFFFNNDRFLYAKRKLDECEKALLAIAKVNGRQKKIEALIDPTAANNISMSKMSQQSTAGPSKANQTSYLTLFTNKWLRRRFLLFTALIIYLFLSYNGILLALSGLGGNIYVNSLIVSSAELFAYIASSKEVFIEEMLIFLF